MTIQHARELKIGDTVFAVNGIYEQEGKVIAIEPHHRQGFWITFRWTNPKGKEVTAHKRHQSVYLENKP